MIFVQYSTKQRKTYVAQNALSALYNQNSPPFLYDSTSEYCRVQPEIGKRFLDIFSPARILMQISLRPVRISRLCEDRNVLLLLLLRKIEEKRFKHSTEQKICYRNARDGIFKRRSFRSKTRVRQHFRIKNVWEIIVKKNDDGRCRRTVRTTRSGRRDGAPYSGRRQRSAVQRRIRVKKEKNHRTAYIPGTVRSS